jgi:hypothetical protein
MTWLVQPLQRKGADGAPLGLWHLCADSDEGGGFYPGCSHDHASAKEAQDCLEARKYLGEVTGFPLKFDLITINGAAVGWVHGDLLTHEKICELAGQPDYASVAYSWHGDGDSSRSGTTYKGKSIKTETGMHISCVVTGSA